MPLQINPHLQSTGAAAQHRIKIRIFSTLNNCSLLIHVLSSSQTIPPVAASSVVSCDGHQAPCTRSWKGMLTSPSDSVVPLAVTLGYSEWRFCVGVIQAGRPLLVRESTELNCLDLQRSDWCTEDYLNSWCEQLTTVGSTCFFLSPYLTKELHTAEDDEDNKEGATPEC